MGQLSNYNKDSVPHSCEQEFLGTRNSGNANVRLLGLITRGGALGLNVVERRGEGVRVELNQNVRQSLT